jgi:hypothetical protein
VCSRTSPTFGFGVLTAQHKAIVYLAVCHSVRVEKDTQSWRSYICKLTESHFDPLAFCRRKRLVSGSAVSRMRFSRLYSSDGNDLSGVRF